MLQYDLAQKLYEEITEKAAVQADFEDFYQEFLQSAVRYANTRISWNFMNREERNEDDKGRDFACYIALFLALEQR